LIQIQISEMQQAYIDAATHSNMHKSMLWNKKKNDLFDRS
jgi:hypothetical protein